MATLPDINSIITKFSNSPFANDIDNKRLFNFFENYILSDNCLYHMELVNNHFYQKLSRDREYLCFDEFKQQLYSKIKFFLTQHIREIRNNIRMRCRINQIDIKYITDFIKKYNIKIKKLDSILNHFKIDEEKIYTPNKYWGNSSIIQMGIHILYNVLLTDNSLNQILQNAINCENNNENVIKHIRIFTNYMKIFSQYGHSYKIYLDMIDELLLQNKPTFYCDNTSNIYSIYNFKLMFNYLNEINKNYYTVLTDKKFNLNEKFDINIKTLNDILVQIIDKQSINQLIVFFETYEQQLQKIIKYYNPDIYKLLTNFVRLETFQNFILYSQQVVKLCKNNECLTIIKIIAEQKFKEISDEEIKFCSNIINQNIKNKNVETNILIYSIFSRPSYEKYMDVFLQMIEQKLIERLVYYNVIQEYEDENIEVMKTYFSVKYLKKFTQILEDFDTSKKFQLVNEKSEYYKYTSNVFSLIVTRDIWNININSGCLKLSNNEDNEYTLPFSYKLRCENNRFIENNVNKHLIFYPHVGSVNITLECHTQDTNITMLPIQMLFFELFYETGIISKDLITTVLRLKFKDYDKKVLNHVINSFVESNIIIDLNHINVFELNLDYDKSRTLNLIEVYNNISNFEVIKEKQMKIELVYSREKILSTVFNHILKTKSYVLKDLVTEASKMIKHFPIKETLVATTIKQMKDRDYLTINDDTKLCEKIDF
jgi:hypothetical protein